jgi:hypothetical protein
MLFIQPVQQDCHFSIRLASQVKQLSIASVLPAVRFSGFDVLISYPLRRVLLCILVLIAPEGRRRFGWMGTNSLVSALLDPVDDLRDTLFKQFYDLQEVDRRSEQGNNNCK